MSDERECGRPPWVTKHPGRCAHFEGRILVLAEMPFEHDCCGRLSRAPFLVAVGTGYAPCHCEGCGFPLFAGDAEEFYDLPAAEVEFDRRNLALLGREVSV